MATPWKVTCTWLSLNQNQTTQPCSSLVLINFCLSLWCVEMKVIHWTRQLGDRSWILPEHFCDAMDEKPGGGVEVGRSKVGCGKERNGGRDTRGVFLFVCFDWSTNDPCYISFRCTTSWGSLGERDLRMFMTEDDWGEFKHNCTAGRWTETRSKAWFWGKHFTWIVWVFKERG